ncbi:MAG TPA: hypothetical protein GXX34_12045 [Clostridia bacterium]|nr:hypothetical protein [Clostridia bacterium]
MHFVLQQEWVNGKRYLVKDGELDSLLDLLNLPSEALEKEGEAEMISEVKEPEEFVEPQGEAYQTGPLSPEVDGGEPESLPDVLDEAGEGEVAPAGPEVLEEGPAEAELLGQAAEEEQDVAVAWYYWPNGTIWRG